MRTERRTLPELLAPAGSAESLEAAIAAGADAVYFGGERFSARARAKNLSASEMTELLKMCRAAGVRAHGAVNIRLRDGELCAALDAVWEMLCAGVDALIVGDLGLARLIRRSFPEAELHASTQLTGTSAEDAAVLARLGFSRMVAPRELSLPELRELCADSPIGIEMFIHGAHCVAVSGQCSMSYVMGGRSGNRGDCAGPCRLPFGAGLGVGGGRPSGYALSLKDMCLAGHVEEIIASGAESLKIEGRLKGPEYTYGVVSVYRRLLDGGRNGTPDEIARLGEYFSRDGFSDGYFKGKYANMLGTAREYGARRGAVADAEPMPKIPVSGKLTVRCGERARLRLTSPHGTAEAVGEELTAAIGRPPSEESLRRSVTKLGQTPFVMDRLEIDFDGICGISASALNGLRRQAAEGLCAPARSAPERPTVCDADVCGTDTGSAEISPSSVKRTALLTSSDQLTEEVAEYFDEIFIPFSDIAEHGELPACVGVSLPEVMYGGLIRRVRDALEAAAADGRRVLVHTLGELSMAVAAGAEAVCSHRLAVYNRASAAELCAMGAVAVTLSPEVSIRAAADIAAVAEVAVLSGGRLPLMLCRRCPMSDGGRLCPHHRSGGFDGRSKGEICRGYLTDRTGAVLPAVGDRFCMTAVYNSVPTYSELDRREAARMGITRLCYSFAAETAEECGRAVRALRAGAVPEEYRKLR